MNCAQRVKGGRGKSKDRAFWIAQINRCQIARKNVFGVVQGDQSLEGGNGIVGGKKDALRTV